MGGSVVKSEDPFGDDPLTSACRVGDMEKCSSLLETIQNQSKKQGEGHGLDHQNNDGNTPLMVSIIKGHSQIAIMILNKGGDLEIKNKWGDTALILSCRCAQLEVCRALIGKGVDINGRNKKGETALINAIIKGQIGISEFLLSSKPDVSLRSKDGNTTLHCLCEKGWDKLCHQLLEQTPSFDLNQVNNLGDTPLMVCCKHSHPACTEFLLAHDADINLRNYQGDTALTITCTNKLSPLLPLLLNRKPNLNHQNSKGLSSLHLSCLCRDYQACELLLNNPSDIDKNLRDNEGNTPLILAISQEGDKDSESLLIIQLLIDHHVDLNVQNHLGDTALLVACKRKKKEIIKLLIENDCDTEITNKKGHKLVDFDKNGSLTQGVKKRSEQGGSSELQGGTPMIQRKKSSLPITS